MHWSWASRSPTRRNSHRSHRALYPSRSCARDSIGSGRDQLPPTKWACAQSRDRAATLVEVLCSSRPSRGGRVRVVVLGVALVSWCQTSAAAASAVASSSTSATAVALEADDWRHPGRADALAQGDPRLAHSRILSSVSAGLTGRDAGGRGDLGAGLATGAALDFGSFVGGDSCR